MKRKMTATIKQVFAMMVMLTAFAAPSVSYAQDTTTGLVGHWTFDETSGTTTTDSVGGYDGTMQNGQDASTDSVAGQVGTALDFDLPSSEHIVVTDNDAFDQTTYTIAAWVKGDDASNGSSFQKIFDKYHNFTLNWDHSSIGGVSCEHWDGGAWVNSTSGPALSASTWYHLACVYDGSSNFTLYVDGVEAATNTGISAPVTSGTQDVRIGAHSQSGNTPTNYFNGVIDDVRFYSRALTIEDIAVLAMGAGPGSIIYNDADNVMQYNNGTEWIAMGHERYVPRAVTFDGTNDTINLTTSTGPTNATQWSGSFWINHDGSGGTQVVYDKRQSGADDLRVDIDLISNELRFLAQNSASTTVLDMRSNTLTSDTWHHVMYSFDLTNAANRHIYIDNVSDIQTVTTYNTAETIDFSAVNEGLGGDAIGGTAKYTGLFSDFWMDFGTYIDLSDAQNRKKFYNAGPVDLGAAGTGPTGTAPDIFLTGDTATWHTNKGNGGGFTENGALTDAPTKPTEIFTNPVIANSGNAWVTDATKLNNAFGITVSGNYAYITSITGNSLTVVDISDPLNPVIANAGNAWITDATKLNRAHGVAISGSYAYVTAQTGDSLTVVDISDPLNPVIANSGNAWVTDATKLNGAFDVAISGSYAYVTANTGDSLTVVDISDPLNPVIANSGNAWVTDATKLNNAHNLTISGDYAYIVSFDGDSLTVMDISDPLNPVIANAGSAWVTDATKLNGAFSITVSGDYAYVASYNGDSLTVVDISDPLNPVIANAGNAWITDATKLNGAYGITISGSYAYVTSLFGDSLTIVDISDPLNPVIANAGNAWITDATKLNDAYGIALSGSYAYVTSQVSDSLTVVDIDERGRCANPTEVAGSLTYNTTFDQMQFCNGADWIAMGPTGDGGAGCLNPAGTAGSLTYNTNFNRMQYCEGDTWIGIGGDGVASSLASGLVGHWKLDESGNISTAADAAGSNNGTLTSFPADPSANWVSGSINGSLSFDGANDRVIIGDPAGGELDFGTTQSFTLSAWINTNDAAALSRPFSKGHWAWSGGGYSLWVDNGVLEAGATGTSQATSTVADTSTSVISNGTWYHVAAVFDQTAKTIQLYVDGTAQNLVKAAGTCGTATGTVLDYSACTTATASSTYDFVIGASHTNNEHFDGEVDDVRVYNRALSDAEVTALYNL